MPTSADALIVIIFMTDFPSFKIFLTDNVYKLSDYRTEEAANFYKTKTAARVRHFSQTDGVWASRDTRLLGKVDSTVRCTTEM